MINNKLVPSDAQVDEYLKAFILLLFRYPQYAEWSRGVVLALTELQAYRKKRRMMLVAMTLCIASAVLNLTVAYFR
jgi:hypothetical protein